ncbi:hypothetical protein CFP56_012068 [Quercus suber]|uniref:Uncharacterized protein n=1 Tax=Quercus suber TaxID=58331 RepID=A0AAW0I9A8_QUESU
MELSLGQPFGFTKAILSLLTFIIKGNMESLSTGNFTLPFSRMCSRKTQLILTSDKNLFASID